VSGPALVHITNLRKNYHGLRPLRIRELVLAEGERLALSGLDAGGAEVLVNLITGASVPDEGDIRVLGRSTSSFDNGDEWLASLERFGIVTPRAVLLDAATLLQNLALPLTLEIDPLPDNVAARTMALAAEVGLPRETLDLPIAGLSADTRMRAHLARAVALDPALLLMEHPTATLEARERRAFGETVMRVAQARSLTTLIISEDEDFSAAAASRRVVLHGATGEVKPKKSGWFR